ncbi:HAD family hydrolase [Roseospira visakhapatnamensis]|uniref:Beta-phosphoglucomutase n=1 Tax=Roseospira visakhapatnamensis TaxID=390880 RepID=A0A7W6RDV8_9PROT|nr:beta-phosphoglucomutase family hydrolase [Roseospira visakhapatnamensis]MBB4266532.1 alpha,alpha-trehalase [Roseospira visakhapatnamensis]
MPIATRVPPSALPWSGEDLSAIICDLDGVITDTAAVHATAWKDLFDEYLRTRAARDGTPFVPFTEADYLDHVDGKPRYDGVRDFLAARGITLPEGDPGDDPDAETVCGLGNRKNMAFNDVIDRDGVTVFEGAVALVRGLAEAGWRTAVVSSSKNCGPVLERVGLTDLFEVRVDGLYAAAAGLPGKPAPDTYLEAARLLKVAPERAVMVEDAIVGVQSGRDGGFGVVVGIDRGAGADSLRDNGAHIVVKDLGDLLRDN